MARRDDSGANPFGGLDPTQVPALLARLVSLERDSQSKAAVEELLARSFDRVMQVLDGIEDLEQHGDFAGQPATLRRSFLRILVHCHEHMGQAVAYARIYGMPLPWPDPMKGVDLPPAEA